jgi:hypothetical protein
VVSVNHARDSIKAETVKLVLFHPEAQVTEQEPQHLVATVVEQSAVPQVMTAPCSLVEVEVVAAIEHVQSVKDVLGRVAVDDIEQNGNAHAVSGVNELLKLVGHTVTAACSEEAVDLVSKAGVVCVLHDGHELDDIVPKVADAGQDVVGELFVCGDFAVGRRDSDVGLVDAGALGLRGALVLENVLVGRVPEPGIVDGGDIEVLGDAGDPGGEALLASVVVGNNEGDLEGQRCAGLRGDLCSTLSLES